MELWRSFFQDSRNRPVDKFGKDYTAPKCNVCEGTGEENGAICPKCKGNRIITMGGIYGVVQGFKEKGRQIVIKVDNNTNLTINKTAIAGLAEKVKDEELEQT